MNNTPDPIRPVILALLACSAGTAAVGVVLGAVLGPSAAVYALIVLAIAVIGIYFTR